MALAAAALSPNISKSAPTHRVSHASIKAPKQVLASPHKSSSKKSSAKPSSYRSAAVQKPLTLVTVSGNISPKVIEIEEGVSGNATKLGTNLYPRIQNGTDPV